MLAFLHARAQGLTDIGHSHLSAIERGEQKPTRETFCKICQALDVRTSESYKR
ncbi:MAG: helix-turn-helix domain-containing protein [Lachnospiraceae bacterium]|nr:helix-turn-helix domain-containing protein [Lachnospiraceae bacterium]